MSEGPKNVLVIAYIFPPLGGSGVYRTVKFVKHLPSFGWHPHVVCSRGLDPFGFPTDETLLREIPADVPVTRLPMVTPLSFRRWSQRKLGIAPKEKATASEARPSPAGGPAGEGRPSLARRAFGLVNWLVAPVEFPPVDAALYWALAIVPRCRRIIEEEGIDLVFTTSFPYSDHVAGLALQRLTGRPWVADFRDPWSQNAAGGNRGWRRRCDLFVERQVLRRADRVIGVTPSYTQGLRDLAPTRPAGCFVTIENGYDRDDFAAAGPRAPAPPARGPATIAHVGTVYDGTALPFLRGLGQLGAAGAGLRVRFVGGLAPSEARWLAENRLQPPVEVVGRVAHAEAIRAMQAADALLLPIGDGPAWRGHYPGKLFEYMACGTPILMIGPEGDASQLVRASGTGCTFGSDDAEGIVAALTLLATNPEGFRAQYYRPRPEVIARYERRALTGRLAALFEELAGARTNR